MVGVETAEFLSQQGCQVKVVEMRGELAADMEGTTRALLMERLKTSTITIMLDTKVEEIHDGRVLVTREGQKEWLEAETIVLALGSVSNNKLLSDLKGRVPQLISVGDCVTPRRMKEAIHEGFWAGLHLSEKTPS
jgi:2,4-dienoyl-CoA reductase (NADPH2)